jgi:signal transduction histidine kinase
MPSPAKVLVIDDEEAARYGMMRVLATEGYELQEASDGNAGLEYVAIFQPDVVLSDINMPGLDGLSLLRKLNEVDDGPLVVLITAYGSEKTAIEALRAGAYDYVAKPYEIDELRNAIRNAVERQRLVRENRRYQAELRQTLEDLRKSEANLVQAKKMAALAGLVSGVAHEINSPLGALQSATETMQTGLGRLRQSFASQSPLDAPGERLMEALESSSEQGYKACRRISQIVSNLSQFAQLNRADFQTFQLNDCVACTAALVQPQLEKGIRMEVRPDDLPDIHGNPRDLNQVVLNLLQNAVEAIRSGTGRGTIQIRTSASDQQVHLEVSDDGCGIPAEHLDSVFDPGFTLKGVGVGLGVGLAICYQIVKAHHGDIKVTSRAEEGSTFEVSLPIAQPG